MVGKNVVFLYLLDPGQLLGIPGRKENILGFHPREILGNIWQVREDNRNI